MIQIPYSILELAVVSEGSTPADAFRNSLRLAQEAEELGYSRFWLAEHHNMISVASSATVVLIGYIAGGTKKIRVGSGGIMLPNHSPLIVAEQFGTLGTLYPGRIDLGLGRAPGTDQVTAHAINAGRNQSVHQFPEDISRIQQYFSPQNAHSKVRVSMAEGVDVPLYILGSSTESARLAARKGLPYAFASHFSSAALTEALAIYHREFQPSAVLKEPYTIACVNVIAADSNEEAERLSTSHLRMIMGLFSGELQLLQPPVEISAELRQIRQHPGIQQFTKYSFIGDKASVGDQIGQFLQQTRVSELMVATNVFDIEDRLKSYRIVAEILSAEKISIRQIGNNDLESLQQLSRQTFYETFAPHNTEENMREYLDTGLSMQNLQKELSNPDSRFYFAELKGRPIGYLKLNSGKAQTELQDAASLEIERIYVLKEYHGQKVGQILFNKAIEEAGSGAYQYLWLGVWEENNRAISFYKKNGFVPFGQHVFTLGTDEQTDIMMKLELANK